MHGFNALSKVFNILGDTCIEMVCVRHFIKCFTTIAIIAKRKIVLADCCGSCSLLRAMKWENFSNAGSFLLELTQ